MIRLKRVYEAPSPEDGCRILVDRLWPRGISKDRADISLWMPEIGPSNALRRWFGHDPSRWEEFCLRYQAELEVEQELVGQIVEKVARVPVTFVYAARDSTYNNAVALKMYIERKTLQNRSIEGKPV